MFCVLPDEVGMHDDGIREEGKYRSSVEKG